MPHAEERRQAPRRARVPLCNKQALLIDDFGMIKQVKLAAVEDDTKMSRICEEAACDWIATRGARKGRVSNRSGFQA
jgi:hypothetical protein